MSDSLLPKFVNSTLDVKITANCEVTKEELNLQDGKSIAQLLYEEKEQKQEKNSSQSQES